MKRLDTLEECYTAMQDALDLIKSCQAAGNRGVGGLPLTKLAEARTALDVGAADIERDRAYRSRGTPPEDKPFERQDYDLWKSADEAATSENLVKAKAAAYAIDEVGEGVSQLLRDASAHLRDYVRLGRERKWPAANESLRWARLRLSDFARQEKFK
jgi:hypothetical protein